MDRIGSPQRFLTAAFTAALLLGARDADGQVTAAPRPVSAAAPRPVTTAALNPATVTINPLPPRAVALRARFSPALSPSVRAWVQSEAKAIAGQNRSPDALLVLAKNDISARFAGQKISGADVEALALLVLMDANASAQDDLKSVMAAVKSANARKASARAGVDKPDTLGDLSSDQQMRMQMAMDRLAKLESTLSNLLKKMSDAAGQLTQNLK